jgi:FPC/CPF motif-containing protein YcgG
MRLFDDSSHPLVARFQDFVRRPEFPCVGAKSAVGKGQMKFVVARDIKSSWDDLRIYLAVLTFATAYRENRKLFQSLVVLFETTPRISETEFEQAMWTRIQSLADKDVWHGQSYDERVSADPQSPHFSLSFGGEAFFVVGLHQNASRPARRFNTPALVFNLHDQFEQLREQERYEGLRASILQRDVAIAGSPNPMLARHGELSEARQYSGRAVGQDWKCPFTPPLNVAESLNDR